jgi:phage terminase small subunit
MTSLNGLTGKQKAFVNEYLKDFNGVQAASRAGYDSEYATLAVIASENLRKPKIREAIEKRLAAGTMETDELLWRLGEKARFDVSQYVTWKNDGWIVDVEKLKADGKGHLIRNIKNTRDGQQIELADPDAAQQLIGKHLGLFTDVRISGNVKHTVEPDFSKLDTTELRAFVQLVSKAIGESAIDAGGQKPN